MSSFWDIWYISYAYSKQPQTLNKYKLGHTPDFRLNFEFIWSNLNKCEENGSDPAPCPNLIFKI